jgi:hypothetical protein
MCYNLQLTLLSTFSKVKVKNNLSCGLLILTIDLIMRVRIDLNTSRREIDWRERSIANLQVRVFARGQRRV